MLKIEDLRLEPVARAAAEALLAAHPGVVFTSGRRDLAGQAHAMAGNVIHNRAWIRETYKPTPQCAALQACVDARPDVVDQDGIAALLLATLDPWTDEDLGHVSKHLSGQAFDVQPVAGPEGEAIKASIRRLPGLVLFLEREGGLVRWHAQFA